MLREILPAYYQHVKQHPVLEPRGWGQWMRALRGCQGGWGGARSGGWVGLGAFCGRHVQRILPYPSLRLPTCSGGALEGCRG